MLGSNARRRPRGGHLWVAVVAFATVLGLAGPAPSASASAAPTSGRTSDSVAEAVHRITLITGDVVTVTDLGDGRSTAVVDPKDLVSEGIRSVTVGGEQYVLPSAALPYVADGTLDRELFNVTALVAQGLDDASRSSLPLIVQYSSAQAEGRSKTPDGAVETRSLESIDANAVITRKSDTQDFWADVTGAATADTVAPALAQHIEHIWLDGQVQVALSDSVAQIGGPAAWDAGYDGTGVTVAVLDTGVDDEHPDLAGQIDDQVSFVPGETTRDLAGHGTHVASTVLGTGAASDGLERGVAPGARLIVGKVLSDDGYGQDSWIIDGMEWAAARADVVNLSLGTSEANDGTDPMSQALNSLSAETGTLFVVAAGNAGGEQTIGSPGAADAALTVGAVDGTDQLTWFTSQGPRVGDMAIKPDLVAPGVDVNAARSQWSAEGEGPYVALSGTSMATPHVTGAAAVLAQRHPDWSGAQLKDALMSATKELEGQGPYQVGTGRLDVAAAVLGTVHATGSAFFGFDRWPHKGEAPVTRTVTYSNDGEDDVTLDLVPRMTDADAAPAPADLLTVSAASVTVPAHGTADVSVTLDQSIGATGARYTGQLAATADGVTVARTSLAFLKEDERYDLTIAAVDRHGDPAQAYVEVVGGPAAYDVIAVDGTTTIRRPAGTYSVVTWLDVDAHTDHAGMAFVGNPDVLLDRDRTVHLDARLARPITVSVPRKATETTYQRMDWFRRIGETAIESNYVMPFSVEHLYAQPTAEVRTGEFELNTRWRLRRPALTVSVGGRSLDVSAMVGTTGFTGSQRLPLVVAGPGAPSDYADLHVAGKAVLVTRSDDVQPYDRAVAARDAGAALLIVVNDEAPELIEWVGNPETGDEPGIPVIGVSGTEGTALLAQAGETSLIAQVVGRPDTPWVYDLQDPHVGRIPRALAYAPTARELARVTASYGSDRPAAGGEFRYDFRPFSFRGIGFLEQIALPQSRVEWVSAPSGTTWYQEAMVLDTWWDQRSARVDYAPGDRLSNAWFQPVVRPRIGEGYWKPSRSLDFFSLNVPAWADSGQGNTGDMYSDPGAHQRLALYQGTHLIEETTDQGLWAEAPTMGQARYRVVNDATRDPARWTTSTSTHTVWRFASSGNEESSELPFLSVDYGIATDLGGRVGRGATPIELTVVPVAGAALGGTVRGARLSVSFDEGGTWQRVRLTRTGATTWATHVRAPAGADAVSLRTVAWDSADNRVRQVVVRAYLLP